MKKSDLRNGMVVETRSGILYLIRTIESGATILGGEKEWINLNSYKNDLKHYKYKSLDIIKVYETDNFVLSRVLDRENLTLIGQEEREIDWTKVPKWTPVQASDYMDNFDGKKLLVKYEPELKEYPFIVARNFRKEACSYKYCRIHPDIVIKEEWYK